MLITADGLLECRIGKENDIAGSGSLLSGPDTSLLRDEGRESIQVTAAIVLCRLLALAIEPFQRGEALNPKALAQRLLGIGIDLGDLDLVGKLKGLCELLVNGGKVLAMPAPGGEELDESWLSGLQDDIVEVFGNEVKDGRFGGSNSREAREHEALDEDHVYKTTGRWLGVFESIRKKTLQCNSVKERWRKKIAPDIAAINPERR